MDFLKKHYEKALLGAVLIGALAAVAILPMKISSEQSDLKAQEERLTNPHVKELTNIDMTVPDTALKRVTTPEVINFAEPNKVFNPMPWQKTPDGHLIPGSAVGPSAAVVTNITPLYLKLTLDSVTVLDTGPKYVIGVEKQAAFKLTDRAKKQTYCTVNPPTKNDTFTMLEVRGKPDEPSQIVVTLNDTGEKAVLTKETPYRRADGYMADLRYDPERKTWRNQRMGLNLLFNNEEYNIVAINQNEVVLSAKSNSKKWTVKFNNPAP